MRTLILTFTITVFGTLSLNAQTKKDGTPDMRYKANKETFGNTNSTTSYSTPKTNEKNYDNGGQYKLQEGYFKSNGTYVEPHIKTTPDNKTYNNYKPKK